LEKVGWEEEQVAEKKTKAKVSKQRLEGYAPWSAKKHSKTGNYT
jgi:hypothetical protein